MATLHKNKEEKTKTSGWNERISKKKIGTENKSLTGWHQRMNMVRVKECKMSDNKRRKKKKRRKSEIVKKKMKELM